MISPIGPASRFQLTVEADWKRVRALQVELLDAHGLVIESYFRPFEYYPPIERTLTLEFGPSLYPDYFLQTKRLGGEVHALRIFAEGTVPLKVRDGSIRK